MKKLLFLLIAFFPTCAFAGTHVQDDSMLIKQIATPSTPAATYDQLYFKSDNKLYKKTPAGTETEIGAGSGTVTGPGTSTANAFAKYSDTTGAILLNSQTTEDVSGNVTAAGTITAGGVSASTFPTGINIIGNKSTTGTRYACFDTSGNLTSSASACSGT